MSVENYFEDLLDDELNDVDTMIKKIDKNSKVDPISLENQENKSKSDELDVDELDKLDNVSRTDALIYDEEKEFDFDENADILDKTSESILNVRTSPSDVPQLLHPKEFSNHLSYLSFDVNGAAKVVEEAYKVEAEIVKEEEEKSDDDIDSKSVFVGGVDFGSTAEELEIHFFDCGIINRITIMSDQDGHPKGYAYIEFADARGMQAALLRTGSLYRGRELSVTLKRTNIKDVTNSIANSYANRGAPRYRSVRGSTFRPRGAPRGRGGYRPRGNFRGRTTRGRYRARFKPRF